MYNYRLNGLMVQMKKHTAMKNLLKYIIAFVLLAIC